MGFWVFVEKRLPDENFAEERSIMLDTPGLSVVNVSFSVLGALLSAATSNG